MPSANHRLPAFTLSLYPGSTLHTCTWWGVFSPCALAAWACPNPHPGHGGPEQKAVTGLVGGGQEGRKRLEEARTVNK